MINIKYNILCINVLAYKKMFKKPLHFIYILWYNS
jgi:hypothetical protein